MSRIVPAVELGTWSSACAVQATPSVGLKQSCTRIHGLSRNRSRTLISDLFNIKIPVQTDYHNLNSIISFESSGNFADCYAMRSRTNKVRLSELVIQTKARRNDRNRGCCSACRRIHIHRVSCDQWPRTGLPKDRALGAAGRHGSRIRAVIERIYPGYGSKSQRWGDAPLC